MNGLLQLLELFYDQRLGQSDFVWERRGVVTLSKNPNGLVDAEFEIIPLPVRIFLEFTRYQRGEVYKPVLEKGILPALRRLVVVGERCRGAAASGDGEDLGKDVSP